MIPEMCVWFSGRNTKSNCPSLRPNVSLLVVIIQHETVNLFRALHLNVFTFNFSLSFGNIHDLCDLCKKRQRGGVLSETVDVLSQPVFIKNEIIQQTDLTYTLNIFSQQEAGLDCGHYYCLPPVLPFYFTTLV